MRLPAIAVVSFALVLLCACGSGPGSLPPERPDAVISGVAFDGPIVHGTVSVYGFGAGVPGSLLGTATTDTQGRYAITVRAADQPVLVEVRGGYYVDEASGAQVPLPEGATLTALANYRSGMPLTVAVTAFTHLAAGLAGYYIGQQGMAVAAAIDQANRQVSQLVGVDIIATLPVDITNPANAAPGLTPGLQYAFTAAALSGWTDYAAAIDQATPGAAPFNAVSLAQCMQDDIAADGVLDGNGAGPGGTLVPLSLGTFALDEDVYRHGLAVQMIRVAQSAHNRTSVTPAAVAAAAQAYNDSTSPIFGNRPVIPFAEGGPGIVLQGPSGWVGGPAALSPTLALTLNDAFGFSAPPRITLDGQPLAVTDPAPPPALGGDYAFTARLDAAAIPDGRHTLGVSATDYVGAVASASFALNVDHTAPQFCVNSYWSGSSGFFPLPAGSANWSGSYRDDLSGVVAMTVDGYRPVLTPGTGNGGTWVIPDSRNTILPDFDVTVTDAAGNVDHFTYSLGNNTFAGPACLNGWY